MWVYVAIKPTAQRITPYPWVTKDLGKDRDRSRGNVAPPLTEIYISQPYAMGRARGADLGAQPVFCGTEGGVSVGRFGRREPHVRREGGGGEAGVSSPVPRFGIGFGQRNVVCTCFRDWWWDRA